MEWKLENDRPIWTQLNEQLRRRIIAGVYPPGSRLPPVRELAAEAEIGRASCRERVLLLV